MIIADIDHHFGKKGFLQKKALGEGLKKEEDRLDDNFLSPLKQTQNEYIKNIENAIMNHIELEP